MEKPLETTPSIWDWHQRKEDPRDERVEQLIDSLRLPTHERARVKDVVEKILKIYK